MSIVNDFLISGGFPYLDRAAIQSLVDKTLAGRKVNDFNFIITDFAQRSSSSADPNVFVPFFPTVIPSDAKNITSLFFGSITGKVRISGDGNGTTTGCPSLYTYANVSSPYLGPYFKTGPIPGFSDIVDPVDIDINIPMVYFSSILLNNYDAGNSSLVFAGFQISLN